MTLLLKRRGSHRFELVSHGRLKVHIQQFITIFTRVISTSIPARNPELNLKIRRAINKLLFHTVYEPSAH
jgi:hypothetical protein